jgi:outer membrane protein
MERMRLPTLALVAALLAVAAPIGLLAQPSGLGRQILTIDDAVRLAQERNITIALANSRVDNAGAHVTSSFGSFLPQFSINASYNRPLTESTVYYQGVPVPGSRPDVLQANASASVQIFDGFARTAEYSSAQSTFNASVEELNREKQSVTYQTRSAFLAALRAQQLIEVRQTDLEVARESLSRIRGMVEAGVAQAGQIYSEESAIANAELALEQARTDEVIARQQLAFLLNVDPRSDLQLSDDGLANSIDSTEIRAARAALGAPSVMYERLVASRADIQAARLRVEAADAQVTAARSGYYPTLGAGVSYSWQNADQQTSSDANFGLNFQYNLFDGFRTREQVQVATAQMQTAQLEVRRLELQAQSDLQASLAQLEGAERQLNAADRAVAAARQNRFAADERYRAGVGTYTDFLLASAQYLNAQINQVTAVYNFRLAIYQVRYHMGE